MSIEPITEWGPQNHRPSDSPAAVIAPPAAELDRPDDN